VCGATWREIDLDRKLWPIPAARMKKGEEHRIHLSAPAIVILKALPGVAPEKPIFPTATGKHHQDARLSKVARQVGKVMGYKVTIHGFRATFRTWGE
jgi:integrase